MTIDILTCFRKIYGLNLEYHAYLIFRGTYIREGLIFGEEFVLVSRGFYSGGAYIQYFTVFFVCFATDEEGNQSRAWILVAHYWKVHLIYLTV